MVLFSAMFSYFLLDSYELQEIISIVSQNMEPLSLLSTSRGVLTARVMMNMLAIRYFSLMLETEESISEIDSHHIFCKKHLGCDRVIKRGLGNLSSQARW